MGARTVWMGIAALCAGSSARSARAVPPRAFASQTSDGSLTLVLRPERPWTSAELTISGDTIDLGPASEGQGVEIEAWARLRTAHPVTLRLAEEDGRGVTYQFVVDTQVVPDRPPLFERGTAREWTRQPLKRPREGALLRPVSSGEGGAELGQQRDQ